MTHASQVCYLINVLDKVDSNVTYELFLGSKMKRNNSKNLRNCSKVITSCFLTYVD